MQRARFRKWFVSIDSPRLERGGSGERSESCNWDGITVGRLTGPGPMELTSHGLDRRSYLDVRARHVIEKFRVSRQPPTLPWSHH